MYLKRIGALVLAVSLLALSLAACGSGDSDSGSTAAATTSEPEASGGEGEGAQKVGLVLKTLANPVWAAVQKGAEEKADELGIELLSGAGKTEEDVQGQIGIVEDMMVQGAEALVVAANGTGQLAPVLERAADEGIKVVLVDTDVPNAERVTLVQTDNEGMSEEISKVFVEELGGKGEVGILTFPEVSPVEKRVNGSKTAIEASEIEIVGELAGDCLRNKAVNATTDLLQANPGVTGIFGECGQNATGAVQAVKNAGKTPGKDIQVIGFDGVPDELALIESGELYATVWQDFPGIGAEAVQIGVDAVAGETFPPETFVPAVVITADNAGEFEAEGELVVRK